MTSTPSAGATTAPGMTAVAGPAGTPVGAPRPRRHVLVVSVTSRGRRVLDDIRYILDTGSVVTLVCLRASDWPELEGQVEFREVGRAEDRHPLLRVERGLLLRVPDVLLRSVAAVFRRVGRLRPAATPARIAVARTERLRRRSVGLGQAVHNRLFLKGYRVIRPWVLWRSARSTLLNELDLTSVDLVLVAEAQAVSIAWHLARARPDLPVTFSLDRSALPPVLA